MRQEIRIEAISVEDLQELVQRAIRNEVPGLVAKEVNRILSTPEEDRLVTRAEAMEMLGIRSRTTIIRLEKEGSLDPVMVGSNRVSYRLQDIKELISNRKRA